jgi:hypothetical protein
MINVGCRTFNVADKSMIKSTHFKMKPVAVTAGAPDTVSVFQLQLISNPIITAITAGSLAIQTSDVGEGVHNAPQSDLSSHLLEVTVAAPIEETVDNGNGTWTYSFTLNLTLAGGVVENGCRIDIELESPFNNLI